MGLTPLPNYQNVGDFFPSKKYIRIFTSIGYSTITNSVPCSRHLVIRFDKLNSYVSFIDRSICFILALNNVRSRCGIVTAAI